MEPWLVGHPEDLAIVSEKDRSGRPLRTVLDLTSGLVRNDPIPSDGDLAEFYSTTYRRTYKSSAYPQPRQILRNFRRGRKFVQQNRDIIDRAHNVLDAGAGTGGFLYALQHVGKATVGVEPSQEYADFCRDELGLDVRAALFSESLFATGSFDLILLNHVLEHLNDPIRYLSMLSSWLRPGGLLYIEVPDIDRMVSYNGPGNMFHYGHIWNFCPETLSAVAGMAGLSEFRRVPAISDAATGAFFSPSEARQPADMSKNAENRLKMIEAHYRGELKQDRLTKPLRKLAVRFEEWRSSRGFPNPAAMGDDTMAGLE